MLTKKWTKKGSACPLSWFLIFNKKYKSLIGNKIFTDVSEFAKVDCDKILSLKLLYYISLFFNSKILSLNYLFNVIRKNLKIER